MDYIIEKISQSKRLGNKIVLFWNRNREHIYIYDMDKDEFLGTCSNADYIELSKTVELPADISEDYETLQELLDDSDYMLGEVK